MGTQIVKNTFKTIYKEKKVVKNRKKKYLFLIIFILKKYSFYTFWVKIPDFFSSSFFLLLLKMLNKGLGERGFGQCGYGYFFFYF